MEKILLADYQALAMRTARLMNSLQGNLHHAALGLTSEAGEVASSVKAHTIYDKPLDTVNLIEEAGDILWFLTLLAHTLGVTLEDIATANIAKLSKRYPDLVFSRERALNRDLDGEREAAAWLFPL